MKPLSHEPVTEPSKQEIKPPSHEQHDVQAENKTKPDKTTCSICGESMSKVI